MYNPKGAVMSPDYCCRCRCFCYRHADSATDLAAAEGRSPAFVLTVDVQSPMPTFPYITFNSSCIDMAVMKSLHMNCYTVSASNDIETLPKCKDMCIPATSLPPEICQPSSGIPARPCWLPVQGGCVGGMQSRQPGKCSLHPSNSYSFLAAVL